MVSGLLVDALKSPTRALLDLYDEKKPEPSAFPKLVAKYFSEIFKTREAFREIPSLNVSNPPESFNDGALVRFRAMVQDTSAVPEIYLSRSRKDECGGWGIMFSPEDSAGDDDINYADLLDCTVVWAISVPGETLWYKESLDSPIISTKKSHKLDIPRPHKYPVPKHEHVGAQIKLYGISRSDALKTADVIDFVGILHSEPLRIEEDANEERSHILLPTLHTLFFKAHPHTSPFIDVDQVTTTLRDELIAWVADEALGGDLDAAEWVLLTSISRVQSHARALYPPSLTISHFPSPKDANLTPTLSHILSLLLPLYTLLPLDLEFLNTTLFAPESIHEDLHSGMLQIPSGSTVLISEAGVREGKLEERGVINVMTMQNVINSQLLSYKFPFSDFSFPMDASFIIASEGSKSAFLKTDLTIPLKSSSSANLYKPSSEIIVPSHEKLRAFRNLITEAKTRTIEFKEVISQHIQDDFVEERKLDASVSPDDLKTTIMVARLCGILLHEDDLSVDMWKRAKELNKRRVARLRS